MSSPPTCATCRFFVADAGSADRGKCHLMPPTVATHGDAYASPLNFWVAVLANDWCGQHQQNPLI